MRQSTYIVGPESISDYLHDIERRWGVRLEFSVGMPARANRKGELEVSLHMPARQHRDEIPWYYPVVRVWTLQNQQGLLFLMWDMCTHADHLLQKGPDERA